MKHAAPKKKAGSVPVSRTIATVAIATAAAGAATPAMAAELPQPDLGLGDLPTTDLVDLPDHDALVSDLSGVVADRGVDFPGVEVPEIVPAAPAELADLAEAGALVDKAGATAQDAEAIAGSVMPASIPPVEQVAPDYTLPGFSGQGDVVPGVLAAAEVVKGSAESAAHGAPHVAADAVDPAVRGVMAEAGGVTDVVDGASAATDVVDGAAGATDVVDGVAGATDVVDGVAGAADVVDGVTGGADVVDGATGTVDEVAGKVAGVPGDDIVGGATRPVEDVVDGAAGPAVAGGVLDTATGLVG
ncbi:hypothetical protein [Myceligenerans pegani]|uniref:Uncharacterized protein n=1 Tax=Myceligenerans pegani TaxID=2776917 RepID=A0ABR9N2W8_9MICO|nr:hypothetical protein [Myceligenerans sp. TRM 65318]MBE1877999.1 hypothetical protein [Myceligenerans sp. TRM 65318]MBE3020270.1 hypothetical protein [Myceligenerans sp. TRM 65318]